MNSTYLKVFERIALDVIKRDGSCSMQSLWSSWMQTKTLISVKIPGSCYIKYFFHQFDLRCVFSERFFHYVKYDIFIAFFIKWKYDAFFSIHEAPKFACQVYFFHLSKENVRPSITLLCLQGCILGSKRPNLLNSEKLNRTSEMTLMTTPTQQSSLTS